LRGHPLCPTVKFVTTETGGQLDSQGLHRVRERLVGQRTGRASMLESRPRSPARATILAARTARHSFQARRLALAPHAARHPGIQGGLASARSSTNGAGSKRQLLHFNSQSATTQNFRSVQITAGQILERTSILDGSLTSVSPIVAEMVSALSLSLDAGMRLAKRAQHGGFHVEDTHHRAIRTKGSVY
jgi:hypothetical protein